MDVKREIKKSAQKTPPVSGEENNFLFRERSNAVDLSRGADQNSRMLSGR